MGETETCALSVTNLRKIPKYETFSKKKIVKGSDQQAWMGWPCLLKETTFKFYNKEISNSALYNNPTSNTKIKKD